MLASVSVVPPMAATVVIILLAGLTVLLLCDR